MKNYLVLILTIAGFTLNAQWPQKKETAYYKVGVWFLEADQHFTSSGFKDPNATRGIFITDFFGRYGISDNLTTFVYIPYTTVYQNKQVFSSGRPPIEGELFSSLGDVIIGFEHKLSNNNGWAISATVQLGLPTGNEEGGSDKSYQTGDGEFNQLLKINLGITFNISSQPFYFKSNLGFNQRSKGYSDEWRFGLETGTKVTKKLLVISRFNSIKSFQNGTLSAANSNGSIFANNVEVTNLGGEIIYTFNKKIQLNMGGTMPLNGRIIYFAPAFSAGIAFKN